MENIISIYESASGLVQCTIRSQGCRYRLNGYGCIMCNYGADKNITKEELSTALHKYVEPILKDRVLFGTYGSILDESEISVGVLNELMQFIKGSNAKTIILETHYKTITKRILEYISESIPNKEIIFEVGLESSDKSSIITIGKDICLEDLRNTIHLVHEYNMEISANILVGVPFKDTKAQVLDALETVQWAFNNKVNSVVLFPMNIKPNTHIYDLYMNGEYTEISGWLLAEVLLNIDKEYLDKVHIAWYGNRKINNIRPITCNKCKDILMDFYKSYDKERDINKRIELIQKLFKSNVDCDCKAQVINNVYN